MNSTQKIRMEAVKNGDKNKEALCKLLNDAIYRKTMGNLRNRVNVELVNNKKVYLKCTRKPSYMWHKIFDNNLVVIRKSKLALKPDKPAYIGRWILDLSKLLMYQYHYHDIKTNMTNQHYYSHGQFNVWI